MKPTVNKVKGLALSAMELEEISCSPGITNAISDEHMGERPD